MKRILVITTSYFPSNGGQEIGLKRILNSISSRHAGYQFFILTPQYHKTQKQLEEIEGVQVYRYNSCLIRYYSSIVPDSLNMMLHMLYGFLFIGRYIKEIKPDLAVVYFLLPSAFPAVFYLRKHRIPHFLFLGGSDVRNKNKLLKCTNKYVFKDMSRIVTTSKSIQRAVTEDYELRDGLFLNIPYGINLEEYGPARKERGPAVRVLCVQRLVESKGTRYLIEAVSRVLRRGISNFQVDIVGDGGEREKLEQLVGDLNLNGVVHFHGNLDNEKVRNYYEQSQVFVFPTLSEGFGIVLLEAMATANIILASNCSSIPEIIRDNHSGILFEPADVEDLALKLEAVLTNLDGYSRLARNASEDVRRYDLSIVGDSLVRVIEEQRDYYS